MEISREISRQIGLIINRRGLVEYVIVGDAARIGIPALSTERVGRARFRGVRLVHTHLNGELLSKEDLTDLSLLQLDLVASLSHRRGIPGETIHVAYLVPSFDARDEKKDTTRKIMWDFIGPVPVQELDLNFTTFITELENEFVRERGRHYTLSRETQSCVLISVVLPGSRKSPEERIMELKDLCYSAGIGVLDVMIQRPKLPDPKYLIGKGKMEEVVMRSQQLGTDLLVFDEELMPGQIMNISTITELKVIDRNQLILDIFANRARTSEAKLQVELAQLKYILPRLAGKNTALSRLTGGIGGRGPGETKLEVDKRRIRDRIALLEKRLDEVSRIRERKRSKRRLSGIPIVSIIGYTNSGKSTLLNLLTKSTVETEDRAFSTLGPTTRLIKYPERKKIIVTDTVGFIKDLPEVLLRAFLSTLEELNDAHVLLHLVDASVPDLEERLEAVKDILARLDLESKRQILVFNKIDNVDESLRISLEKRYNAVSISCLKKIGIEQLIRVLETELSGQSCFRRNV